MTVSGILSSRCASRLPVCVCCEQNQHVLFYHERLQDVASSIWQRNAGMQLACALTLRKPSGPCGNWLAYSTSGQGLSAHGSG